MDLMCRRKSFFKNPSKLPLNELHLEVKTIKRTRKLPSNKDIEDVRETLNKNYDVRLEKKPALDPHWIQKEHSYTKYQPYYSEVSKEENELFIPKNKLFAENLKFLLQCTYHQFWNYILYEPRVKSILKSFIFNPVHSYELKHIDGEYLDLYNDIYIKVANIYLRMFTFKESNSEFMNDVTAIKLLETHKIISYMDIMSLTMLYSKTNRQLVIQLYGSFFNDKQKDKYTRELSKIINHSLLIFEMVGGQVCGFEDNSVIMPVGIRPRPHIFDPYWIEEVVTYLLDTASMLNSLLANYPPAIEIAINLGIPLRLTYFYNRVYPTLYEMMQNRADLPFNWPDIKTRIIDHIAIGRSEFVEVYHSCVTHLVDQIIQTLGDNEKQDAFLEHYLSLVSTALEDEFFIFDYHNTHQIDVQLQTLSDFHPQIDHMRTSYILECLSTLPTIKSLKEMKIKEENRPEIQFSLPPPACTSQDNGVSDIANDESASYSETKILDLTKLVVDTLPYLGDGFIRECLKSYNYNTTELIAAILDENLPPHLNDLPRDLLYVPPEPEPPKPALAYRGKKPDYKDATQLLNDKSDLEPVKDFILKVSNVSFDMYDDEYDDRYDDEPVLRFYDKTDESSMYEHMGNKFEGYELVSDPSDSSSEDEPASTSNQGARSLAFCEDPALLRARREANRNGRGRNHDVVGKPKGQGQDKSVLHNRDKKTTQKSTRANHNRKGGAQWKRNKGMIPS